MYRVRGQRKKTQCSVSKASTESTSEKNTECVQCLVMCINSVWCVCVGWYSFTRTANIQNVLLVSTFPVLYSFM